MSVFTSRRCEICCSTLQQTFSGINDAQPRSVPHHATKDSLVDSVVVRSCHLCRLVFNHLKLHWSKQFDPKQEPEIAEPMPIHLTEEDFANSDFSFESFPDYRIGIRSCLRGLPENLKLEVAARKYTGPTDGIVATLQFDSESLSKDELSVVKPSFWVFNTAGSTIDTMMAGFDLDDLPKTFRDAVAVARWADIRYIWIDSCCILQRSDADKNNEWKADWKREARMMQHVYKNTYFNISADHSENSHGGLFSGRLAYKFSPCAFNIPSIGQIHILSQSDFISPITQAPISQRAWVIQERFLSPRVLHFTSDQMFWECSDKYACETFPKGMPQVYGFAFQPYRLLEEKQRAEYPSMLDNRRVWGRMCEDYSAARLTFTSDKLIAFSGMAKDFHSRQPSDTYLAGMWKSDFVHSLVWSVRALDGRPFQPNGSREEYADPYITASSPLSYRAPSWSWISKDCSIFWSKIRNNSRALIEILNAHADLVNDDDPTGDIQGGFFTARGFLRRASWIRQGNVDTIVFDGKSGKYLHDMPPNSPSAPASSFLMQRDVGDEFPTKTIFCLPVRHSYYVRTALKDVEVIDGLMLEKIAGENQYTRIGCFEMAGTSFRRAMTWQLLPPAQELEYPWHGLDVEEGVPADMRPEREGFYEEIQISEFTVV
ncbi:hypothetical protein BKA63DRAFT_425637 [Paraphoma chrysanthemicola]|nr:hypothetical protein BKA63DRAFT_425637 [Paraphoma chrysanthemicola]